MTNIRDVYATSGNVSRYQNLQMIIFEEVKCPLALWLIFVAMNRFCAYTTLDELILEPFDAVLCATEYKDT